MTYILFAHPNEPDELRLTKAVGWPDAVRLGWWFRSLFPSVPLEVRLTTER